MYQGLRAKLVSREVPNKLALPDKRKLVEYHPEALIRLRLPAETVDATLA